jgi:hypothetical protein
MGVYKGRLTTNSATIEDVTSLDAFQPDLPAKGVLVPIGTYVVSNGRRLFQIVQHNWLPYDQVILVDSPEDLPTPMARRSLLIDPLGTRILRGILEENCS